MANYAMVDTEGNVTNICEWDGVSDWTPPDGITLIKCTDYPEAERGGTYTNGVFARAVNPVPVSENNENVAEQIAAMQEQLAALLAKVQ